MTPDPDLYAAVEAAMARVDALAVELAEQARIAVVADDALRRSTDSGANRTPGFYSDQREAGAPSTGIPKARDRVTASLRRVDIALEPTW